MTEKLRIGFVAGEASGDNLAAGLMAALRAEAPKDCVIEFVGVGGARMCGQGLKCLYTLDVLSVNGFRDPILKLPALIRLFKDISDQLIAHKLDMFVGVDFNVFNFLLEGRLKKKGVRTVHYVSPSVYAWRRGRTRRVAKVADAILCLFPFEPQYYENTDVKAVYVGHPLADEISPDAGSAAARDEARKVLGMSESCTVIAVLPGSRRGELTLMLPIFLQTAAILCKKIADVHLVIPCAKPDLREMIESELRSYSGLSVTVVDQDTRRVLAACDIGLIKSGTSTLEAMLMHRPMVISYRMGRWSYQLAKRLLRSPYVALPNILSNRMLVPELLQYEGSPENLAAALQTELERSRSEPGFFAPFEALHTTLRRQADVTSAQAVLRLTRVGSG